MTPKAGYVWGTSVTIATLRPGDIIQLRDYSYTIQLRDYSYTRKVVVDNASGTRSTTRSEDRPHPTAVVQSVDGNGAVTVLE